MTVLIKGIQKITLIDYPNKIASEFFVGGCNFRCPFCQNKDLVLYPEKLKTIREDEAIEFLKKRLKFIEGVVISGGEPTIYEDLPIFFEKIKKETQLPIKLDTNGSNSKVIKKLIEEKLVDYIAMDIKSSKEKYSLATNVDVDIKEIDKSIKILKKNDVDYEFRTTVVPEIVTENDIEEIGKWIAGAKKFAIQQFIPNENCIDPNYKNKTPYAKEKLIEFQKIMKKYISNCEIRNI
ncbi:MAG: anaerobic ribonucleoside-triphosphate reductase activating protein [Candidatus Diapherotrites archaeon]|nr:anaerobic ribonucleoside-triphosphate reductase activating protein [Candidatus Diapherotrites archaeon]